VRGSPTTLETTLRRKRQHYAVKCRSRGARLEVEAGTGKGDVSAAAFFTIEGRGYDNDALDFAHAGRAMAARNWAANP
jgi:hypothetical protein